MTTQHEHIIEKPIKPQDIDINTNVSVPKSPQLSFREYTY